MKVDFFKKASPKNVVVKDGQKIMKPKTAKRQKTENPQLAMSKAKGHK